MNEHQLNTDDVRFFCGQSHPALAQEIANDLGEIGRAHV